MSLSFLENARDTVQPHGKLGKNWMSRDHCDRPVLYSFSEGQEIG